MIAAGVAMNGAAFAGATISDKRYWPNGARGSMPYEAFASGQKSPVAPATPRFFTDQRKTEGQKSCRYQGGSKSGRTVC